MPEPEDLQKRVQAEQLGSMNKALGRLHAIM